MKRPAVPTSCERCDRVITDQTGWGVMMLCSIQPQVESDREREHSLFMCGYCFHELADWLSPARRRA